MFLVKREESRNFDVFLGVLFLFVFGVWKREKTCREARQGAENQKNFSLVWGVRGAIYSPRREFRGSGPSKAIKKCGSWYLWKDLGFLILKRCGTWKSNGRIKSYGFLKFAVRRLVRHPGFCDILAVLTRFWPMNSRWNDNSIIFTMALVSTRSDN